MNLFKKRVALLLFSLMMFALILTGKRIYNAIKPNVLGVGFAEGSAADSWKKMELTEKIPEIYFNGSAAARTLSDNVCYIPQDLSAKEWVGHLTVSGGSLYWERDPEFKDFNDAVASGHKFTLWYVSNDGEHAVRYSCIFTGLPVMALNIEPGAIKDGERKGNMSLLCPQYSRNEEVNSGCSVAIHGGTSRWYEKNSYKLKLDKKSTLLGMRKDDDWVLNALYDDAGLIHNKLSYDLWNEIADSNSVKNDSGVKAEYVELLIRGEYRGVYLLTERIDRKLLSLSGNDILYKCVEWWDGESKTQETYGLDSAYEIKFPKETTKEEWLPLKKYNDIFNENKEVTYDEASSIVDMDSVIDYELFCQVAYGWDNLMKNTYLSAEYDNGRYIIKKIPWDINISWGNKWVWNGECNYNIYDKKAAESTGMWCFDAKRFLELDHDRMSEALLKRYRELRENIFTEQHITELAEKDLELLKNSGAYERNYARWSHGSKYWKDEYLFDYIDRRLVFLDEYLKNPVVGKKEQ